MKIKQIQANQQSVFNLQIKIKMGVTILHTRCQNSMLILQTQLLIIVVTAFLSLSHAIAIRQELSFYFPLYMAWCLYQ